MPRNTSTVTRPAGGRLAGNYGGRVVNLCAGPGGMDMGARILGLPPMIGVEFDDAATATGRAAGFERRQHDIRHLSPKRHRGVHGVVITPPCPTFNSSGKGTGRQDMYHLLDANTCLGIGCSCEYPDLADQVQDQRTALAVETTRWLLQTPGLEWLIAEEAWQVAPIWEDIAAEAYAADWQWADVLVLDAADYGLPVRRRRAYLIARRSTPPQISEHAAGWKGCEMPRYTMAEVLGLDPGTRVWTRGNMTPGKGGNAFVADGPSWSLTGSARSWKIGAPDGPELTAAQAGHLQGFPLEYPWQGSRTRQFLQLADVVHPVMAAIALGIATDTPWVVPVLDYLTRLYGPGQPAAPPALPAPRNPFDQLTLEGL